MTHKRHKPLKGILDRDFAAVNSREFLDHWSPYLEELCDYATNVLGRCEKSMKGVEGTASSLIFLYYHIVQMADGINAACSSSCFTAAIPMLRSLWEGALSIEFMLKDDFENRSSAWMVQCHLNSRSFLQALDPSTDKGKKIQSLKKRDLFHEKIEMLRQLPKGVQAGLLDLEKKLKKKKFELALNRMTDEKGRVKKWYSVNKGPTSLEQLAFDLGKPLEYEFLYRQFSEVSHAQDASRAISTEDGNHYMAQMRSGTNAETVYLMTTSYLIIATRAIASKLRPEENVTASIDEIVKRYRGTGNSIE